MDTIDFLYQAGALKDVERSGWKTVGISPESVSEHSYRTALVAYVLAKEEKANGMEGILLAALLHDLHEVRISDLHQVAKKYAKIDEERVREDSLRPFPELCRLFKDRKIMEIVHDADKLELILQAKEYQDLGNPYVKDWIKNASASLKTKSAKRLCAKALKRNAFGWLFEARK
ncbi:MAG: HD domain-containing protein [Candidatus Bilamarchaeaceae archaeon]